MDKELKNILKMAIIVLLVMMAFGWIGSSFKVYIGLIVGAAISICNFLLSYRDAATIVKGGINAKRVKITGFFIRYMIVFITMIILINFDKISFFASLAGILLIRVVIYIRELYKFLKKFIDNNK